MLKGAALGVTGALLAAGPVSALGLDTYPEESGEAEASVAGMTLGGEDLFGLAQSQAGSESNPGPNTEAFNGAIGGSDVVDFGSGYQIPLDEFLEFGEIGAVQSRSTATDGGNGEAITGIVGADGGLTLDGTDNDFGTASIDLLSIAKASGADGVTDQMIDQADLSFGLGGAWVEAVEGEFQDPDAVGEMGQYRVGDMKMELHSPAVEAAGDGVSDAAGEMEESVVGTINDNLDLAGAIPVPGVSVETEVTTSLREDVLDATLLGPISTDDGLAEINLGEGTVVVDLGRIGGNDDGVIDRPVGINNQDPNTELIDDETYPFIASSVHDVIEETVNVSVGAAMDSLESVSIGTSLTAPDGTTATWNMTLAGEVTDFECSPGGVTGVATCATLEGAMGALGPVMAPINEVITNPEGVIYEAFTTIKTDLMTVPVRAALDPFLELIANNLFSVQINHQVVQTCESADGGEQTSGLEVSALSIGVLDGTARLGIGNAGVRVDPCNLAADDPAVSVESPAPAGECAEITSSGWAPGAEVSFQLTDAEGNPVGEPVTATADEEGNIDVGTCVTVPEDAEPGDYTVIGEDSDGNTGEAALEVYAPEAEVDSPVAPGECADVVSGGWVPGSEVTIQLTDAEGNPTGEPTTAVADDEGNLPEDTCVTIPEDAAPGDYEVIISDDNGAEITSPVEVSDEAAEVALEVTSPVTAGDEAGVSSEGWAPDTEVSVQLTDPEGNPVGDPVTVTTDEDGAFPEGTVLPIPEDAVPGDYTVVATDPEGNEATDTLEVTPADAAEVTLEATSPVRVGNESAVTSEGWAPGSEVSVQLTDPEGNPVGDPVTVTTDENGAFPEGTVLPVPEDAVPGDYTVVATDPEGNEATDTLQVVAADAPLVDASSPVTAGDDSALTGEGWAPDTEVSVQLTDPEGNPVGDPVVVTTDENGAFPEGTVLPVPEDAVPGDYTVVATDPEGNEATDTLEITPADAAEVTLEATSPVRVGDDSAVASEGWAPGSEVSVQLTDPEGNPVGDPVVVTTDENGAFPEGTVLVIPSEATPADGYTVTATDADGAEATDTIDVIAADAELISLDASSPAAAGGESDLASAGWAPGSEVSVQLTDPEGNPVGDPVTVTTDEDGAFPEGTVLPIPEDAAPGDGYTVTATDPEGNEATDTLEITPANSAEVALEVTSPVAAGDEAGVSSEGWAADTEVSVQLVDPEGNPVGDPVVVTTDENGAFPEGTVLPVPADAVAGDYSVVATDPEGTEATADLEVIPADAGTCVSDAEVSVQPGTIDAGGTVTISGSGFEPGRAEVALTDTEGNQVGNAVEIEVGDDCSFSADVIVSDEVTPGEYELVVTDGDGNSASSDLVVTAGQSGEVPGPGDDDDLIVGGGSNGDDSTGGGSNGDDSTGDGSNGDDSTGGGSTGGGSADDDSTDGGAADGSGAGGSLAHTGFDLLPVAVIASLITLGGAATLIVRARRMM